MPRIERAEEFKADIARQVSYLRRRQEFGWIETLRDDLVELEALLSEFPLSGRQLAEEGTALLLRLRLRTAPFYVWYGFDPTKKTTPVQLYRLFHVRQRSPEPRWG